MKLISFTVPCYNSAEYMDKCIESLLPGGELVEIIIVDDGSTDRTGEIADEYAAKYPGIIRAVHQKNGGHGAGINTGIGLATGKYFKVVDSDDWLDKDSYQTLLARLDALETDGGVDLLICNYVYYREGIGATKTIGYAHALPENRVFGWDDIGHFNIAEYITLHSAIYSLETLKKSGIVLPEHTFYEDNLFVYTPLPYAKRLYYMNVGLYMYYVGRPGQSVATENLKKRYAQQAKVSVLIFKAHNLDKIREQSVQLYKYMRHEVMFMLLIAVVFTRLNNTPETEQYYRQMWEDVIAYDKKWGRIMRYRSRAKWLSIPGKFGRFLVRFFYWFAHLFVKFN